MNQVEVTFRKTRVEKVQEKRRNENHRTGGKCDLRWVGYVASDGCIKVLLVSATFRQTCPAFLTETRTARNPRRTARYPRRTARYPRRTARYPRRTARNHLSSLFQALTTRAGAWVTFQVTNKPTLSTFNFSEIFFRANRLPASVRDFPQFRPYVREIFDEKNDDDHSDGISFKFEILQIRKIHRIFAELIK